MPPRKTATRITETWWIPDWWRCNPDGIRRGGVEGLRTPDLVDATHALSQLSYDPEVVELAGLEPAASAVPRQRSPR